MVKFHFDLVPNLLQHLTFCYKNPDVDPNRCLMSWWMLRSEVGFSNWTKTSVKTIKSCRQAFSVANTRIRQRVSQWVNGEWNTGLLLLFVFPFGPTEMKSGLGRFLCSLLWLSSFCSPLRTKLIETWPHLPKLLSVTPDRTAGTQ